MRVYKAIKDGVDTYILDVKQNISPEIKAMSAEELAAIGWSIHEDYPKPEDTPLLTHDLRMDEIKGIPKITWVPRAKTNEEITRDGVRQQIDDLNALLGTAGVIDQTTLRGIKATANADINASPAKYIKALADILIDLIRAERRAARMITRRFESTD